MFVIFQQPQVSILEGKKLRFLESRDGVQERRLCTLYYSSRRTKCRWQLVELARESKYSRTLVTAYRDLAAMQEHRYGQFLKRHGG